MNCKKLGSRGCFLVKTDDFPWPVSSKHPLTTRHRIQSRPLPRRRRRPGRGAYPDPPESFNELSRWIELMQTQEGLQITRASLVPVDGRPGRVNAELTLERGA